MTGHFTYVTDRAPKPFVHPLRSPSGRVLSVESPADHPWQRGLWFAVKFVDADNFWEEVEPFGRQVTTDDHRLEWVRPDGRVALLEERSVVEVDPGLGDGSYAIDWTTALEAAGAEVVLDRTPYTSWGGYGGLTFRGAPDWCDTRVLTADGSEHRRPVAVESPWCDLSSGEAGLCLLDHPSNPRHPVPWYGASRSRAYGEGWANYLNAAFLFHQAMTLPVGQPLVLRYRVVVHDGRWDAARAQAAWEAWAR